MVRIKQVQIEQDTAKSQTITSTSPNGSGQSHTLVDLNRAGTGLMEIVTEPDMRSAAEAGAFVRRLQSLLRRIGSGDGDMEKGNLRIDANVSVRRRRPNEPFGTRCEIKNLNSVRFLQTGIAAEAARHVAHYTQQPGVPLKQETRGLNEMTGKTFSLRTKEEATDYRYMPDGNLPAINISPATVVRMQEQVPEMPWETVQRLIRQYGLNEKDAETITNLDEYDGAGVRYFETAAAGLEAEQARKVGNWLVHESLGQLKKEGKAWSADVVPVGVMREMVAAIEKGTLNGTAGKAIIRHFVETSAFSESNLDTDRPRKAATLQSVLDTLGLQMSDPTAAGADTLETWCNAAIARLPKEAKMVAEGNDKVVMRIVGEVMKLSSGAADARKAKDIIVSALRS
jgi:aspartyl-tRNA(Asn)/glutamyl-tRNA(Gln) amidotransferase subunit B